uniref:Solute carrier family 35 member F6 n=1 Tax=Pongo abelii TaxID=9601 RepID=A0A8I5T925_PONAB
MAWTKYQLFLAGLMLVTGSINTLSAKWADNFMAEGCGGSKEHSFQHPFLQSRIQGLEEGKEHHPL